jgi:thiol-disulfide isomerase/thioredoxin
LPVQTATDADFLDLLAAHPRVVVKYYADWCGYCRLFAPSFEKLARENPGVAFLEVNAEYNPMARRLGGVHHLPFFSAFDHGRLLQNLTATDEGEVGRFIKNLAWKAQP